MELVLKVYGRSQCHLCQNMLDDLNDIRSEYGFSIKYIDIDGNSELESLYGLKVPVLMAEEREICHYTLDFKALKGFLGK
ncbi:MAG: glutaredoxin family protein [Gammaproteobacteria bacterium]|nr:glutaredoxin family protein [Gammaproteobacteria bacterium]MCK5091012.1 glutaredoxin family protein [Gammaproteobacteria bacterium]